MFPDKLYSDNKETCACRKDGDADKQENRSHPSNALISLDLKTA